jgi:hypothetical protein
MSKARAKGKGEGKQREVETMTKFQKQLAKVKGYSKLHPRDKEQVRWLVRNGFKDIHLVKSGIVFNTK